MTARIAGKSVSTCEPSEVPIRVVSELNDFADKRNINYINSNVSIINYLVKQHQSMTVIHPFADGSGRSTRAFFNQQLLIFRIPLFYISVDRKESYYMNKDYGSLFIFIVKNI